MSNDPNQPASKPAGYFGGALALILMSALAACAGEGSGSPEISNVAEGGSAGANQTTTSPENAGAPDGEAGSGGDRPGPTRQNECSSDVDCEPGLPPTLPADCAEALCVSGYCIYQARDLDGDGHRAKACKSRVPAIVLEVGDDCDEEHADANPDAWDGPADATRGLRDGCDDGLDQDCSGTEDDGRLADGTTCACQIGDEVSCSETESGIPIAWPIGKPVGTCRYGTKRCVVDDNTKSARFSLCVGAIPPQVETCDNANLDQSCAGDGDDDAALKPLWYYDADHDLHAAEGWAPLESCARPSKIPNECDEAFVAANCPDQTQAECCPANAWRLAIPVDDCDDHNPSTYAGAPEICDRLDNDCSKDGTEQLEDADQDGFAPKDSTVCSGGPLPKTDCKDYDERFHPGAPGQPKPDCDGVNARFYNDHWVCVCLEICPPIAPTFDYDCDGEETPDVRGAFDCSPTGGYNGCVPVFSAGTLCGTDVAQKKCGIFPIDQCAGTVPLPCH